MATKLDELQQQIDALQKQRDDLLAKERTTAINNVNALIQEFGLSAKDLSFGVLFKATPSGKPKVAMKYKAGPNAWSGRGRKPKWVDDHLKSGGTLDDIAVK